MTLNEKIALKMGWVINDFGEVRNPINGMYIEPNFDNNIESAKLLLQKMVDDGWTITFRQNKRHILFSAYKKLGDPLIFTTLQTEPTAIVSLFMKVYGLEV